MQTGRLLTSTLSIVALLWAGGSVAFAQAARPWVDPPLESGAAAQPAPPPPSPQPLPAEPVPEARRPAPAPVQQAQPQQSAEHRASRPDAAKNFAIDYLASWSARNDIALDATAELYAPRVLFHGRTVSLDRLYKEKKRFTQRWPEREYRPREESIGTSCNPAGTVCTVHAVFDYTAANPKRRRLSQGSGALQLIVEFIGEKPLIVAEHSTLIQQTRKRILTSEGSSNE